MVLSKRLAVVIAALALLTTACGEWNPSFGPTSPSGTNAASNGATIHGKVKGWGLTSTTSATTSATASDATTNTVTVSVVGTNISTTVSVSGNFVLEGVPSGTIQLRFSSSAGTATVSITGVSAEDIDITVELNGSTAVIVNITRTPAGSAPPASTGSQTIEGAISSFSYGDRSMKVNGIEVKIWDAPVYQGNQRVGLSMLAVGQRVRVRGDWVHDYLVATDVTIL
jgi:hypothetical protein